MLRALLRLPLEGLSLLFLVDFQLGPRLLGLGLLPLQRLHLFPRHLLITGEAFRLGANLFHQMALLPFDFLNIPFQTVAQSVALHLQSFQVDELGVLFLELRENGLELLHLFQQRLLLLRFPGVWLWTRLGTASPPGALPLPFAGRQDLGRAAVRSGVLLELLQELELLDLEVPDLSLHRGHKCTHLVAVLAAIPRGGLWSRGLSRAQSLLIGRGCEARRAARLDDLLVHLAHPLPHLLHGELLLVESLV